METNCYIALLDSHSNCHLLTTDDQAGPVEDYFVEYLTKESEKKTKRCIFYYTSINESFPGKEK